MSSDRHKKVMKWKWNHSLNSMLKSIFFSSEGGNSSKTVRPIQKLETISSPSNWQLSSLITSISTYLKTPSRWTCTKIQVDWQVWHTVELIWRWKGFLMSYSYEDGSSQTNFSTLCPFTDLERWPGINKMVKSHFPVNPLKGRQCKILQLLLDAGTIYRS